MSRALRSLTRTLTRCLVCGFAEVRTDAVIHRGVVFLAECPRCEHRWTWREGRPPLAAHGPLPAWIGSDGEVPRAA